MHILQHGRVQHRVRRSLYAGTLKFDDYCVLSLDVPSLRLATSMAHESPDVSWLSRWARKAKPVPCGTCWRRVVDEDIKLSRQSFLPLYFLPPMAYCDISFCRFASML